MERRDQHTRASVVDRPDQPSAQVSVLLAPGESAGPRAREFLEPLGAGVDRVLAEQVGVLVEELVSLGGKQGSGAHGQEPIALSASVGGEVFHVEVADHGFGLDPREPTLPEHCFANRGLQLVERLADRWGVRPGKPTTVWFELAR
jgi:anti-sigma regulatory factor (Ser/Thr protein kinase)